MQATIKETGSCRIRPLRPIPRRLRDIPGPPERLWIRGTMPGAKSDMIAIVGSRRPTAYGRRIAAQLAGRIAGTGVPIVSGLAFGIDTVVHTAALDVGGRSVAVMPTGLADGDISPQANLRLARMITARGALVSEYPAGTTSWRHHYEARNRLISGLARAVVIIEASRPSGTLITARHGGDQGRDVWAVPGPIDSDQSLGTNWLIDQGVSPLVSIDAFLEHYGLDRRSPALLTGVAGLLADSTMHFDELVAKSGRSTSDIEAELIKLELAGRVRNVGERYYTLA